MKEKDIESWCKKHARKQGWWVRKFTSPGHRSAPDDIFAKTGHVFFTEFKATGVEPTELQKSEHGNMEAAGLVVWVCDSREKFEAILAFEEEMRARKI